MSKVINLTTKDYEFVTQVKFRKATEGAGNKNSLHPIYTPELRDRVRAAAPRLIWRDEARGEPIEQSRFHLCPKCNKPMYHVGFEVYGAEAGIVHVIQDYHCSDCNEIAHVEHRH